MTFSLFSSISSRIAIASETVFKSNSGNFPSLRNNTASTNINIKIVTYTPFLITINFFLQTRQSAVELLVFLSHQLKECVKVDNVYEVINNL